MIWLLKGTGQTKEDMGLGGSKKGRTNQKYPSLLWILIISIIHLIGIAYYLFSPTNRGFQQEGSSLAFEAH